MVPPKAEFIYYLIPQPLGRVDTENHPCGCDLKILWSVIMSWMLLDPKRTNQRFQLKRKTNTF